MQLRATQPQSEHSTDSGSNDEIKHGEKTGRETTFDHGEYKRWSDKLKSKRDAAKGK